MANKKPKYKKITSELKERLRVSYVQGDVDPQGFRRLSTIEELAEEHKLSKNTLYKLAQRENWKIQQEKFQQQYEEEQDLIQLKYFAKESKKLDANFLNMAKALLARIGQTLRNSQSLNLKDFTPQQLDSLASAALKTQKFAKLALGETTDNIKINANDQETESFRRAMELLDQVAEQRAEKDNESLH